MSDNDQDTSAMSRNLDLETDAGLPLLPDDCGQDAEDLVYDETGALTYRRLSDPRIHGSVTPGPAMTIPLTRPCSLAALNGSWNITIRPKIGFFAGQLRGPMRLEAVDGVLRVSGDLYYKQWAFASSMFGGRMVFPRGDFDLGEDAAISPVATATAIPYWNLNWYPHYPFDEYSWYFRSTGASYSGGELYFPLMRHLWNKSTQEFVSTEAGWMRFTCSRSIVTSRWYPQPTIKMTGEAMIGGKLHVVTATKTSPYYRGSVVEVDVMTNRSWPASAGGNTFTGSYRGDGIDLAIRMSHTNVPEDNTLTDGEMHTLLSTWRDIADIDNTWRIWTLVGSKRSGSNTFGLMFDQTAPHREGCVSYSDATFGSSSTLQPAIKNKKLGEVPVGHLRTLVHEVGHVLNLYHPKHDVHNPGIGTTIMNQTGDVMGQATAGNLYPDNATFAFNDHNRTSLIHSPDPQVAPGWKPFGWGHGSLFSGLSEPTDSIGLHQTASDEVGLQLDIEVPPSVVRGEFIVANVTVTNRSASSVLVSSALNLSEGDLELDVTTPSGRELVIRDVVQVCGHTGSVELGEGESLRKTVQLFYGNNGHVFDEAGRYGLRARFVADAGAETTIDSGVVSTTVTEPATDRDREMAELSMDRDVGLSIALGDFTHHDEAKSKLQEISQEYATTDTGTAAALVLANSYGRTFRDVRKGSVLRKRNTAAVSSAIDRAMEDIDLVHLAQIATTIPSAGDREAPVIAELMDRMSAGGAAALDTTDSEAAIRILEDFTA
ncbi:MAG: hypothetical protein ABFR53_10285 [Actinomycetota bacterium]